MQGRVPNCVLSFPLVLVLCATVLHPFPAEGQAGSATEDSEAKIIARIREYADHYVSKLPDFLCVQTTSHYVGSKSGERWHKKDVLTAQLVFREGEEKRTVKTVNGKALVNAKWAGGRHELTTEGEFGILLANILGPNSSADIIWQGFEKLKGTDVAVIKYAIDQQHSTLKMSRDYLTSAFVPYYGQVFADPGTGSVLRIIKLVSDLPPELETENGLTIIDYSKVQIGGADYLLPSTASAQLVLKSGRLRNEMSFADYQKFEANSTIIFQP